MAASGDDPGVRGPSLAVGPVGDARSVSDSSPLRIFVRAKKKINDIFVEIEEYVRDTVRYVQSVQQDGSIVKSDDAVQVEGYIAKVRATRNVLTRNHMKVAFFGSTSNGKSSVINAMLRENILPCFMGHTTNCFLQVEGSDSGEPYLVIEGSTEKQNVKSVEQLADALCEKKLTESQLVHIYWPKDKCLLLTNEVVFVDCPGIDVSPNLDKWIKEYCQDADVFVLVANAESTLKLAEKNFFHKMSTRLANPIIFILNNRWDASASESHSRVVKLRAQHMERAVEFLVPELEAKERIFFVSAKEALQARVQEQKGLPADNGFSDRYREFQDFEQKFEECISKSAVRTKFEKHSKKGKDIVSEIRQIIDSTYDQAQQLKTQKAAAKKEICDRLNTTEQQLPLLKKEMDDKIQQIDEDVEQMVSGALSEEIHHLAELVDKFKKSFNTEEHVLNAYKKELHHHVENGLCKKLHRRLSTELVKCIENSQREMTERLSGLLPAEKKQALLNTMPQQEPFKIFYRPNWDNLCADFHEDLDFKFTLDNAAEIRSFGSQVIDVVYGENRLIPGARLTESALVSRTGRTLKAILAGAIAQFIIIGFQYVHEQSKWDNKAKETEFKRQFVAHVTKKQQQIVDLTSADCSHQVQQELSRRVERLYGLVNKGINDMDAEIKTLDEEIKQLEEAANSAKVLWNKANYITKQLEMFDDEFLKLRI